MTPDRARRLWNRLADRYAARQIKDTAAYDAMLSDVAGRLSPTDRVLELGCGTGTMAIRLAPRAGQWIATDLSDRMIRIAQAKPVPEGLSFRRAEAGQAFDGGPFDVICAFNLLHLVDDLPGLLARIHDHLKPAGLLISKTWCFADMPLKLRALFPVLRLAGLFPVSRTLSAPQLHAAIAAAGFEGIDTRVFGARLQNPYIVARKPAAPGRAG